MYKIIKGKEGAMFSNGTHLDENVTQEQLAVIFEWQKDGLVKYVEKEKEPVAGGK